MSIGIDLGTTYSCVAIYENDRPEVIVNDQGNRTTPSCIAFTPSERLTGDAAWNQMVRNPHNTIFDIKRMIGRRFTDPDIQSDMRHWPFKITNHDNLPHVQVTVHDQEFHYSPEELSGMILNKMRDVAQEYLGHEVQNAVVTVPAYFNASQRKATRNAGELANLNILQIVNEPTAAAIAYGLHRKSVESRNILVYDLGGGTFDVSVLTATSTKFEVIATGGDTHLGGEDFDNALMERLCAEFDTNYGKDLFQYAKAMRRLRTQCERAKRILSAASKAIVEVDSLVDGMDFSSQITRQEFEQLIQPHIDRTMDIVTRTLQDAGISKSKVDEIVLIGGSTRIPLIRQVITTYFGKQPCKSINPDEAVACGAAIVAYQLSCGPEQPPSGSLFHFKLREVTPLTLGIRGRGGIMNPVIKRNTELPCKHTIECKTAEDNQSVILFRVYEGERPLVKDNHFLGKFAIDSIPQGPSGSQRFELTFELDIDGSLTATAKSTSTGDSNSIKIDGLSCLSRSQVDKLLQDVEVHKQSDQQVYESMIAWAQLDDYVHKVRQKIQKRAATGRLTDSEKSMLDDAIERELLWLQVNRATVQKAEVEKRHQAWKKLVEKTLKL